MSARSIRLPQSGPLAEHRTRRWVVVLALAVAVLVGTASWAAPSGAAHHEPARVPTAVQSGGVVQDGVEVSPPATTRTGPDPTGQPIPSRSQRFVDTAVWAWLVVCLAVAVALVLRAWLRIGNDGEQPGSVGDDLPDGGE